MRTRSRCSTTTRMKRSWQTFCPRSWNVLWRSRLHEGAPKLAPALTGPGDFRGVPAAPVSSAKPSVTDPGQAPAPSSWTGGSLAPPMRSLEHRCNEPLDQSAMTPQAFVEAARAYGSGRRSTQSSDRQRTSSVRINEIHEDGSEGSQVGPRSFAPPKPDEVTEV